MVALAVRRKCVGCSYVKGREKLVIVLREYCTGVDRLFVFQCFSDVFKGGSCEVEGGSLGLAERGGVGGKGGVASKDTSKEACRLQARELLVYFCNTA
jgi:hypothetical protein